MAKALDEWMRSGAYLPPPLRDFHDQKSIFKRIWEMVEKRKAKDRHHTFNLDPEFSWVHGHIFVIDFFLWFMAAHGYTLQKTRQKVEHFADLDATMKDFEERRMEMFRLEMERDKKEREEKALSPMTISNEQRAAYERYCRECKNLTLSDDTPVIPMSIEDWLRIYGPTGSPPRENIYG